MARAITRAAWYLKDNADLQYWLKTKGFYSGVIDGLWGAGSKKALTSFLDSRSGKITYLWKQAGDARNLLAAKQLIISESGISVGAIDGFDGPSTQFGFTSFNYLQKNGAVPNLEDLVDTKLPPTNLPKPAATAWPLQKDMIKFYGAMGTNQTMLQFPYRTVLSYNTSQVVTRTSCHEKCHDPAERVLKRVLDHYGQAEIDRLRLNLFGGCLDVRLMRGSKTTWSIHSWGCAWDWDTANNQLHWGRDKATLAKPAYDVWWRLWEEEGFVSLGRERNYDWMHVQAARLG